MNLNNKSDFLEQVKCVLDAESESARQQARQAAYKGVVELGQSNDNLQQAQRQHALAEEISQLGLSLGHFFRSVDDATSVLHLADKLQWAIESQSAEVEARAVDAALLFAIAETQDGRDRNLQRSLHLHLRHIALKRLSDAVRSVDARCCEARGICRS